MSAETPIPVLSELGRKFPWADLKLDEAREQRRPQLSPEQVKRAQEQKREELRLLAMDYAHVFGTAAGERVLAHLKAQTLEQTSFDPNMGHDRGIAHGFAREGQNALVRYIMVMVRRGKEEG